MTLARRHLPALAALAAPGIAAAQPAWPERAVRIIVPFPPGGGTDTFARQIAQHFQARFNQPFAVENRSGGSGIVGTEAVMRAAPDGYTLAVTASGPLTVLPQMQQVPYDTLRSFAPVGIASFTPLLLVAPANTPTRTLPELLARLRRERGRLTACNIGVGSPSHLSAEMFARAFQVEFEQLPHRGSAPALTDTVAGTCDFLFDSTASSSPLVRQGQLVALGVTSLERMEGMPEIRTIAEQGSAGFQASTWSCVMAPAGTPIPIVEALNREVRAWAALPATRARMLEQGSVPLDLSPEGFRAFIEREIATWGEVIRAGNIRI
jgi:tripartite-type tricarboxylate transporter receptor subunit TctC